MTTAYPGGIDAFTNPTSANNLNDASVLHDVQHANANDAVHAIETELGTNPKGTYASVAARLAAIGATLAYAIPVGSTAQFTRTNNSSALYGATIGTEYAVGIMLPAITIDQLGMEVVTAAGTAGSILRLGLRPIAANGTIGAPVADAAVPIDTVGQKMVTLGAAAVLSGGLYALSWTRQVDATAVFRAQTSAFEFNPNLVPLASNTAAYPTANGHGPVHGILNTGVTGALPSTVTINSVGTNQENNGAPQMAYRRSA